MRPNAPAPRRRYWLTGGLVVALLAAAGLWLDDEIETSRLQATHLARYAATLDYRVVNGASDAIRFPTHGPFNQRMGYSELPNIASRLSANGFKLTRQARFSEALLDYTGRGYFPPYREKTSAGLTVTDCQGETLYRFRYPYRAYADFAAVPPRIGQALMYIENRDLLDESRPTMNPAVDWVRFARAVLGRIGRMVNEDFDAPGGSTLATQIEKFRHSPDGVTPNSSEKLRQMASASVRAYRDGEQTLPARRTLLLDYLNTVPLSAAPTFGEVNGLGDGLRVWFGADFDEVNALLAAPEADGARLAEQGRALHQVVALMIAHRRPTYYLSAKGHDGLARLSESYVRLLAEQGVISPTLRDAALAQPLQFRNQATDPALLPADAGKGAMAIRNRAVRPARHLAVRTRPLRRRCRDDAERQAAAGSHQLPAPSGRTGGGTQSRPARRTDARPGQARRRLLQLHAGRKHAGTATASACRPTPPTSRSTSTRAASWNSAPPPSCAC